MYGKNLRWVKNEDRAGRESFADYRALISHLAVEPKAGGVQKRELENQFRDDARHALYPFRASMPKSILFFCFLFRATSIPVSPPAAHLFARSSSCRVGDQLNFTCNPLLRWYIELPLSLSQTCGVLIYFKYILRYEIHLIFCTVFQN